MNTWDDFVRVLPSTASVNDAGRLQIGGCPVPDLAHEYGTPLFVFDEDDFRDRIARYKAAFGGEGVHYAGKAFLVKGVAKMVEEAGVGLDCSSGGELHTALSAGFPPGRIVLHGNNKSAAELQMAVDAGVGRIVVDSAEELVELDRIAGRVGKQASILLRVTPGIEAHTHDYLKTGIEDTKFGVPIGDVALESVRRAEAATNVELTGLHAHIGSQIFDLDPFAEAARTMVRFLAECREASGLALPELDLGGGLGISYTTHDDPRGIEEMGKVLLEAVAAEAEAAGTARPLVRVEPGRSVAGPAMITVYTSGVVKDVPGVRRYVSIDGGMTDNIRPALYGAEYTFLSASRPQASHDTEWAVAGKLCETGDVLTKHAMLPQLEPGELIAVAATGAYCYAMSSNYNRLPKPAVVAVRGGRARLLARRETLDDLLRLDV